MSIMTVESTPSIHPFFNGRSVAVDSDNRNDAALSENSGVDLTRQATPDDVLPYKPRRGRPPKSTQTTNVSGIPSIPQMDGPPGNEMRKAAKRHSAPANWLNGQPLQLASASNTSIQDGDAFPEPQDRKRRKLAPDHVSEDAVGGSEAVAVGTAPDSKRQIALDFPTAASAGPTSRASVRVLIPASSPKSSIDADAGEPSSPVDIVRASSPPAISEVEHEPAKSDNLPPIQPAAQETIASPPRRVLQLQNGKFPSPKSKRIAKKDDLESPKPKRGRPKKSLITVLKYNKEAVGARILAILDREPLPAQAGLATGRGRKVTIDNTDPMKPTHPFFTGKDVKASTNGDPGPPPPSPRKTSACTPGKLRAEVAAHRLSMQPTSIGPLFGSTRPQGGPTQVGLKEAPFPDRTSAHVRGLAMDVLELAVDGPDNQAKILGRRKNKQLRPNIEDEENLLSHFRKSLILSMPTDNLEYPAQYPLRPTRRLMALDELRETTLKKLHSQFPQAARNPSIRYPTATADRAPSPHPALMRIYADMRDYLSPFDRFECETQSWTSKYRPLFAEHVLQSGPEALILRDWLKRCTINAVQTSSKRSVTSIDSGVTSKGKVKVGRPKKRRKTTELDDFIVGSEDEADQLEDFEEIARDPYTSYNPTQLRSSVRGGLEAGNGKKAKLATSILLSGPHGCGKTASVYAVAKELGFEIFEINAGSRRSGKDILDKIGNMTENHLVQHVAKALAKKVDDADAPKLVEAMVKPDDPSPKQNKLASFFTKAKKEPVVQKIIESQPPLVSEQPKVEATKKAPRTADTSNPRPRQQQKQSLILFEEVDVLFEEDKQFWLTVLTLAINSKRPIVLTCSDASVVPIEALTLHAVLRLLPPPTALAVDYLLLLAAREGHLLTRLALEGLYVSRNHDLRASIADLDFWCQMGVGDNKGGLEWLFQRWPPGSDVNGQGQTLRVTSADTYREGLGWIGGDIEVADPDITFDDRQSDALSQLRSELFITGEDLYSTCWRSADSAMVPRAQAQCSSLTSLDQMWILADRLSAADLYCDLDPHAPLKSSIDPSVPPVTDKKRASYTSGQTLVQDDEHIDFSTTRNLLACAMLPVENAYWSQLGEGSGSGEGAITPSPDMSPVNAILASLCRKSDSQRQLDRHNFARAFDALAESPTTTSMAAQSNAMLTTSFDREFKIITTDLGPYIRIIAKYDLRLEAQRMHLSNLLCEGGMSSQGSNKKARTTRASRSALEGGKRATTRRERWFDQDVNLRLVLETGGKDWAGMGARDPAAESYGRDVDMRVSDDELSASQG